MVYVQDCDGKPLMPTERHGKVRRMLRDGLAVVVRRTPFTIRLIYPPPDGGERKTQPITLGVDAGSKIVGLSASTEKKELYSAEVELRNDITELLATRRQYRRSRRGRKTRYRQPRFLNRVKSKHKGWLAPSIENKIATHLIPFRALPPQGTPAVPAVIRKVCKLLPVTKIVVEVAAFDLQRIKALEAGLPAPEGTDYCPCPIGTRTLRVRRGYFQVGDTHGHLHPTFLQHGPQEDFWNVREYVLWRDGHKCQHCHGKSKDPVLQVHHLESRKTASIGVSPTRGLG